MAAVWSINIGLLSMLSFFVWRLYRRHASVLQLGVLFAFSLALNYPVRILTLLMFPETSNPTYPGLTDIAVLGGLSLVETPAIIAFCLGYWIWDSRSKGHSVLRKDLVPRDDSADFSLISGLYAISLVAKGVKIATGNYVSFLIGENQDLRWSNIVENLSMAGWVCLAGVWVLFFSGRVKRPAQWALFVLVTVAELSYQVIQGSKTFLLLPFVLFLLSFYYVRGRIPFKGAAVLIVFAAVFVFPFVGKYRDLFGRQYSMGIPTLQDFDAREVLKLTYRESKEEEKSASERLFTVSARFSGADELYNLRLMVPAIVPLKKGKDFVGIVYTFIPRFFWPSKPIFSPGAEYGEYLGTTTSITPFPIGEMHWNFGTIGMPFAMAGWGFLLATCMSLFNRMFAKPEARFFVAAVYLFEAYWLTTGEGMLAMQVSSVLKKILIYMVLYHGVSLFTGSSVKDQGEGSTEGHTEALSPRELR